MSVIISLTNQKGGVGKTSSTLDLGAALNIEGKRALLIDNDPQGNLTAALGIPRQNSFEPWPTFCWLLLTIQRIWSFIYSVLFSTRTAASI